MAETTNIEKVDTISKYLDQVRNEPLTVYNKLLQNEKMMHHLDLDGPYLVDLIDAVHHQNYSAFHKLALLFKDASVSCMTSGGGVPPVFTTKNYKEEVIVDTDAQQFTKFKNYINRAILHHLLTLRKQEIRKIILEDNKFAEVDRFNKIAWRTGMGILSSEPVGAIRATT